MTTAWLPHTRAISSIAIAYETASPPTPPHFSGVMIPIRPSSPIRLIVSCGKRASRSISAAMGRTSRSAKSRATSRIIRCSSVRSRFMSFVQELLEFLRERRHDLEEVADDAVVRVLEDGRLGFLVAGDDHLRRAQAGRVRDRARHAEAEIELRRDRAARLADLEAMRTPARVDGGARRADGRTDHLAHVLQDHVVLGALHAAAARDDDLGLRSEEHTS